MIVGTMYADGLGVARDSAAGLQWLRKAADRGLAWNLKAWWALTLPEMPGRWRERHRAEKNTVLRMEFKTSLNAFVQMPCQIIRTGRRLIYRLLSWNPWQNVFFRVCAVLRC